MKDVEKMTELEVSRIKFDQELPKIIHEKALEIVFWGENAQDLIGMAIEEEDNEKRFALLSAVTALLRLICGGEIVGGQAIADETPGPDEPTYEKKKAMFKPEEPEEPESA